MHTAGRESSFRSYGDAEGHQFRQYTRIRERNGMGWDGLAGEASSINGMRINSLILSRCFLMIYKYRRSELACHMHCICFC
jgi:hypothetical protein